MSTKSKGKSFTLKRFLIASGMDFAEATDRLLEDDMVLESLAQAKSELEDIMDNDGDSEGVIIEVTFKLAANATYVPSTVEWD